MHNYLIDVGLHGLLKWQDRCYRASRELCSYYLFFVRTEQTRLLQRID